MMLPLVAVIGCAVAGQSQSRVVVHNDCHGNPAVPFLVVANQGNAGSFACPQTHALGPGESVTYTAAPWGQPSQRFWGMAGCDNSTGLCTFGQSIWNDSGFAEPAEKYRVWGYQAPQIPAQSYFEVSFGCSYANQSECADNPSGSYCGEKITDRDWFDVSAVDGLTPLKVEIEDPAGKCVRSSPSQHTRPPPTLSTVEFASKLDLVCKFDWYFRHGDKLSHVHDIDLRVVDMDGRVLGCASPCQRLTAAQKWFVGGQPEHPDPTTSVPQLPIGNAHPAAAYYCCAGEAAESSVCSRGIPYTSGAQTSYWDIFTGSAPSLYYLMAMSQIYSQPFSDNSAQNNATVNFNCETGDLTYHVLLQCPVNHTVPVKRPTEDDWLGVNYALMHRKQRTSQCSYDVAHGSLTNCPDGAFSAHSACGNCTAFALEADFNRMGESVTVNCACRPYLPEKVDPVAGQPKWIDSEACASSSAPVKPEPRHCRYRCADEKCLLDAAGSFASEADCVGQCVAGPTPLPPAPVYACDSATEKCVVAPAGTAGATSELLCQEHCPPGPTPPGPTPPRADACTCVRL